ncbi:MAG TPA: thioester reductase domain-containing protein, partial [Gammaproteobacteria bacterium]|nr:thioester reductase domain-containing protein [Gammaproteobacteria bacterium]
NVVAKRNLRKALAHKLPEYMIPAVFTVLPKFPLTFNGKIDWKALPEPENFERLMNRDYVPPRNPTEKIIAEIWQDILKVEKVSIHDNFFDLGGNSLLVAELSIKLLEKFHTSIPLKIFFDLPFIDIIAEYIDSKGTKYTEKTAIQDAIMHDAFLNEDIIPMKKFSQHIKKPQKIFLTGASGFLGIHLLKDLITHSDATIYCLIRKKNGEDGETRLLKIIQQYALQKYFHQQFHRIKVMHGDIGKEELGLTVAEYAFLSKEIDLICHCGAEVNLMASYSALRQNNVLGTIEIIKLATHIVDKPIHYISTLSAAHKLDKYGNFSEEFPDGTATSLVGGYALSKWVAERLLTEIKNRGLPVSIYRAGYILGQTETGITNINESLLFLIKGCIQLGFAPDWQDKILFLPVDFVSLAIVNILLHHPTTNKVYHIEHRQGITWRDLIDWLNNYGYKIKLCSKEEWTQKLTHIMPENALYVLLPQFLSDNTIDSTKANTEHADKVFESIDLHYPTINDALLVLYIKYLNEIEFISSPEKVTSAGVE